MGRELSVATVHNIEMSEPLVAVLWLRASSSASVIGGSPPPILWASAFFLNSNANLLSRILGKKIFMCVKTPFYWGLKLLKVEIAKYD